MEDPNKTKGKDIAHAIAKGGLGAVPVIGSLASEIFSIVITPPLEKRRTEWMNEIANRLKDLEQKNVIEIQELKDNDQFIDVVLQATTYALKTSEDEKIKAFPNAILNTAIGEVPDKTKNQIFLNLLDSFTTWHIRILKFIDNPKSWYEKENRTLPTKMMSSISRVLKDAFPELKDQDELLDIIWNDLENAGLRKTGGLKDSMSGDGTLSERTTSFGKDFLNYISKENK